MEKSKERRKGFGEISEGRVKRGCDVMTYERERDRAGVWFI